MPLAGLELDSEFGRRASGQRHAAEGSDDFPGIGLVTGRKMLLLLGTPLENENLRISEIANQSGMLMTGQNLKRCLIFSVLDSKNFYAELNFSSVCMGMWEMQIDILATLSKSQPQVSSRVQDHKTSACCSRRWSYALRAFF